MRDLEESGRGYGQHRAWLTYQALDAVAQHGGSPSEFGGPRRDHRLRRRATEGAGDAAPDATGRPPSPTHAASGDVHGGRDHPSRARFVCGIVRGFLDDLDRDRRSSRSPCLRRGDQG